MRKTSPRAEEASTTANRKSMPNCGAARPTPGIASITEIISCQISSISRVIFTIRSAGRRKQGCGQGTMRRLMTEPAHV